MSGDGCQKIYMIYIYIYTHMYVYIYMSNIHNYVYDDGRQSMVESKDFCVAALDNDSGTAAHDPCCAEHEDAQFSRACLGSLLGPMSAVKSCGFDGKPQMLPLPFSQPGPSYHCRVHVCRHFEEVRRFVGDATFQAVIRPKSSKLLSNPPARVRNHTSTVGPAAETVQRGPFSDLSHFPASASGVSVAGRYGGSLSGTYSNNEKGMQYWRMMMVPEPNPG